MTDVAPERLKAWQCIGCGKIDAPQTCIGVCQDRCVEFVYAAEYEALLTKAKAMEALLRHLSMVMPREGEWERSYRALQARARDILAG